MTAKFWRTCGASAISYAYESTLTDLTNFISLLREQCGSAHTHLAGWCSELHRDSHMRGKIASKSGAIKVSVFLDEVESTFTYPGGYAICLRAPGDAIALFVHSDFAKKKKKNRKSTRAGNAKWETFTLRKYRDRFFLYENLFALFEFDCIKQLNTEPTDFLGNRTVLTFYVLMTRTIISIVQIEIPTLCNYRSLHIILLPPFRKPFAVINERKRSCTYIANGSVDESAIEARLYGHAANLHTTTDRSLE